MQKVIAIVGPTASGKTSLGISLAKRFEGEVISADSRQLYRGMDILAGTPSLRETQGIPHHLLRVADPKRQYSAGRFASEAARHVKKISAQGRVPIVVGGTGFYTEALLSDKPLPEVKPDTALRSALNKKTAEALFKQLQKLDPRRAATIDPHNKVRLIRAIEIANALGEVPLPEHAPRYKVLWLGLSPDEKTLRKNIRLRIKERLKRGMVKEIEKLRTELSKKRFLSLGAEFSLVADYLDKKITRTELQEKLEQWEMHYTKRQMRFMRRNANIIWLSTKSEAAKRVREFLSR